MSQTIVISSKNLPEVYHAQVQRLGNGKALHYWNDQGRLQSISWEKWARCVRYTALGLAHLGITRGRKVGILSENCPEWTFADLGVLSLGAVTVPIYPSLKSQDIRFILDNAEVEILFISGEEQYAKIKSIASDSRQLRQVIFWSSMNPSDKKAMSLETLWEIGRKEELNNENLYESYVATVTEKDTATIIYTSGTTGPPKGVVLTHGNFLANIDGVKNYIPVSENDLSLSFLPLSHVFERMAGYYYMISKGAQIAYAKSIQTVAEEIKWVRPTVAAAVPRFYEKVYAKILEKAKTSPLKYRLFQWCVGIGKRVAEFNHTKRPLSLKLKCQHKIAGIFLFNKIKASLGGRIRFFISGGAPLSKELAQFFHACDVLILEGYGLTETSPVIAVNPSYYFRFGTVGMVLPNLEVKIAEDGEILVKGPTVMQGYYGNPVATAEVIQDGWFHTGDIGTFDQDGFLRITDRKKDIIVTSGGKNISPQNIEGLLLQDPAILQAIVIGDQRNYLVALLVPARDEAERLAKQHHIRYSSYEEFLNSEGFYRMMEKRIMTLTENLARHEQIKYFAFCGKEFSLETGELTPTLKIKRRVVMEKYAAIIDRLYQKGQEWEKK